MENSFVVAGYFNSSHEAYVFRTKLASLGIDCFLDYDRTSSAGFIEFSGNAGVRVSIQQFDYLKASDIISDFQEETDANSLHLRSDDIQVKNKEFMPWEGYCPNCDYDKIYIRKTPSMVTALTIITVGLFAIFTPLPVKYCTNCQHFWKD